ncbi:related to meiotically up-regulated gene 72 protein [Cephalotrichum gorgonifer]|uniref:Related to meiotically up-regulated gene 72 protein n=1 Tax=Cephalotrichum gorgonifer TaxID=2041049 RepID=A0AAE8MVJ0_9PEZI|nr:related to meiotically up-regulated gene 72 protein [Cephalotrichum gorgonifer]
MAGAIDDNELMRVCSVGGNAVSAFLSWRLQATNACDVTLVWKAGYDHVSQYGISMKSAIFGNERFKPRHVVRVPEEATAVAQGPFDYVILCIKALPDVYDIAGVIESVVTPQHTCILVNTTHALGVEAAIEERFPTNVVLSLVSGAEVSQLGQSEFEHRGSTEIWVGPANQNERIPVSIQEDMAQALAMTLSTGQVDCKVSPNIRQQQYERLIGPIAFHPASVIFETPNHAALLEKVGVRELVSDVIDELLQLADHQKCKLPSDFKQKLIEDMTHQTADSIMWQDYTAKRPMEVETFLGAPVKLAKDAGIAVPRIETLYTVLHHLNVVNRQRPGPTGGPASPSTMAPPGSRAPSQNGFRPMMNGNGPRGGGRPRIPSNMGPPGPRRGPPVSMPNGPNGFRPSMNGPPNGYAGSRAGSRRGSMEGADLEEFQHLSLYEGIPEGGPPAAYSPGGESGADLTIRERELQLRQRELALREQEFRMRRGGGRRGPMSVRGSAQMGFDEDDEDDEYVDPMAMTGQPMIDPDNFDMMSVTSRKNRRNTPSAREVRNNPGFDGPPPPSRGSRFRPFGRNRTSQMSSVPSVGDNILDDPLMGYSSNRYGAVDRGAMQAGSRANSLTASRLDEFQHGQGQGTMSMTGAMNGYMNGAPNGGGVNGQFPRRTSQSPGNPYSPSIRGGMNGRPSPPNGYAHPGSMNGRPSPPNGVQQPVPRYPPGQGNSVAPHQVEQHAGVSSLYPPQPKNVRSLTGSASASANSGDSVPSLNSSQSSLGQRPSVVAR